MSEKFSVARSMEIYKRAGELIPGWTQLISRRASSFASGFNPVYAQRAKGSHFVDVDGNEYIDWVNAVGAVILGHADEVVDSAVKEQIDRGSIYTVNSPLEIELAEVLIDTIPSAEMVRYTKAGGEACAVAVRIARGKTGRDKILFCGYHGWHDWYQAANFGADPETGSYPISGVDPTGIPKVLAGTVIPFLDGDVEMLEGLLNEHKGEVAAIIMEPVRSGLPDRDYLKKVKELAKAHDVILIFDEVSSGWRLKIGGVQEYVGVTPDMTVVAKAMSNGYPMGAVVGSKAVMEPAGRMFISSSYWSDNIGLVASITTIRELKRRDSETRFREIGEKLQKAINDVIGAVGLSGSCAHGIVSHPSLELDLPDEAIRPKVTTLFIQEMARRGVHTYNHLKATLAHTDEDIQRTAEAASGALKVIKSGLENDNLDSLVKSPTKREPFRRLVR